MTPLLALLAVAAAQPQAAQSEIRFEVAARGETGALRETWPAQPARFPGGVTGQGDIVYAQPLHYRPLRLDLYRPAARGPLPLVVHVHGGAWVTGTKRHGGPMKDFPAVLAQLAARGFVIASVEYRLDGEAHFPAAIQDVKAAIRFLRQHAADYGIDPGRVGIFGGSAGGQLAGLAGVSCGVAALEPSPGAPATSDCVQAAAGWYGVYDFATVPTPPGNTGPAPYLGCESFHCPDDKLRFASAVTYIDPKDPPFLLIHGLADTLVAPSQTREFEAALKQAGVPVEAIYIADVDHGFVGKTARQTWQANEQALKATFAFFERTLKQK